MAIDADLSAGMIDDKQAHERRRELEQESSFFGSMDGASKFVRGDAIAGLLITAINMFGGVIIGYARHDMQIGEAADVFVRLSVGDGLVSQIPALIVSLAAGLLVSRGGQLGSTDEAVIDQLGGYPRALFAASGLLFLLALMPGLPFLPFVILASGMAFGSWIIPRSETRRPAPRRRKSTAPSRKRRTRRRIRSSPSSRLRKSNWCLASRLPPSCSASHEELAFRVAKMRKKFATQYGFVVPEIKVTDDISIKDKSYHIRIHGTTVAANDLRVGELLVVLAGTHRPSIPGDEIREPAFGLPALSVPESFGEDLKREGFQPIDNVSVVLTHLSEVIRNNLPQLLSYKDMKILIDRLDPEYRKLADEICTSHMSYSGFQAVLKLLLAERVSIRNLHLILEAVAELAPHVRKTEQIVEHVRIRMAQQLCGDIARNGQLNVLRLGNRWDLAFHQALKRDPKARSSNSISIRACLRSFPRKRPRLSVNTWTRACRLCW
jgi:flagellar biosynthesis protein FlhA